ncbi:MAG: hypothetical protein WC164_01125 [Patescibacteria group bacterium]|nr:hypothetical protein [Patescibacteria group bacterium]
MKEDKNIKELKRLRFGISSLGLPRDNSLYFSFFKNFYSKNKVLFFLTLILILSQTLLELLLLLISRDKFDLSYSGKNVLILFISVSLLFIFFSYFSLKKEKTLSVYLTNEVRRRIVSFYLNRREEEINSEGQAGLMAKVSYHLPLLSSFVTRVFFAIVRWLFYFICFVYIVYLINFNILWPSLIFILISILIIALSYLISRYYISKEVTFYSQILRHISFNFSDKSFVKRFFQGKYFFKKFDRLVDFDTYFRIRRDLWFRLAGKLVFLFVIIIYFFVNFQNTNIGNYFENHNFNYLFLIFLVIYISRALYEASSIGLYIYPAWLGIILSILPRRILFSRTATSIKKKIIFSNLKTKLFLNSAYYRRLFFSFERGRRYLFVGDNFSGKSSLAMTISGLKTVNPLSWKIKIDDEKKINYSIWSQSQPRPYFFDPLFKSSRTLIEFIVGKDKETISINEIEKNIKIIQSFDLIVENIGNDSNYNTNLELLMNNFIKSFAVQCAHCLVNKPDLIVIDNLWIDLNYDEINKMLSLLSRELNHSIIVVFSKKDNEILKYYKKYEINKKEIKEKI